MARNNEIRPIKGTFDLLPEEFYIYEFVTKQLKDCFESFGYRGVDIPIVEYADLHLRKSGEELISKMYAFKDYGNRDVCLRPELTASVARAFVNNLQSSSLPVRLYYIGPAFRYDKPQHARYRQFTHAGIEMIGSKTSLSDAEVIGIACKGLELLGLKNYRVVIGHIGFVLDLLSSLELDERVKTFFVESMEQLSKERGIEYIKARLRDLDIIPGLVDATNPNSVDKKFVSLLQKMKYPEATVLIHGLLEEINVGVDGTRIPKEVAERLLSKIKRKKQRRNVDKALNFIERLSQIRGIPPKIFEQVESLISEYELDLSPLAELKSVIKNLGYYNIDWGKVSVNLGFGRGLQYYTGIIFEIYYDKLGTENQICGGGRYDDLVRTIGGKRDIPALGFSYGVERVKLSLEMENKIEGKLKKAGMRKADIFIIPIGREVDDYAIKVSEILRNKGLRAEMDVMERKVSRNLKHTGDRGIPFAILIGEEEKATSAFKLRDMRTKQEQTVGLDEVNEVCRVVKENRKW